MDWRTSGIFASAVESSIDCVKVLELGGALAFMNEAGRGLTEIDDFKTIEGVSWPQLWPERVRDQVSQAVRSAAKGSTVRFQADCPTAKGRPKTWDVTVAPLINREREITALLATSRDITERVNAEHQAQLAAVALRSAHRLAGLSSWEYDCGKDLLRLAPELVALLGETLQGPVTGRVGAEVWDPADRAAFTLQFENAKLHGGKLDFEGRVTTPQGVRWLHVLGEGEVVDGVCVALRGAAQDVTVWREAMERLQVSERQAQAAAQSMSSFLATMSHEIRTPLNGVLGMADAMQRGPLEPVQRERLTVVREFGQILLNLLNDLLDLSRIQEGQLQLEDGVLVMEDIAGWADTTFSALVRDKDICFEVAVDPAASGAWRGDPTRVRQIVGNLLSNAVKFTERGVIRLAIALGEDTLAFSVDDTGPGISAERLPLVFDRFVQADASTTRRFGGSGLGLAICRDLARLMGGDVAANSTEGKGSRFTVTLPAERAAAIPPVASPPPSEPVWSGEAMRVLAADDNATNRLLISTLLSELGCDIHLVENGVEAVAAAEQGRWDLILMDIQMPEMDGETAIRHIRDREAETASPRTPILALTANAMEHQRREYLAAGADGVVPKPISLAGLVAALEALAPPEREAEAA